MPYLLTTTSRHFNIESVFADGGYLSEDNIHAAMSMGATLYLPFRTNSIYHNPKREKGRLWNQLLQYFREHNEEFLERYHKRSNIESVNGSMKALFSNVTRNKTGTSRVNEVLCKAICHNLVRLVHASYTDGVKPFFS